MGNNCHNCLFHKFQKFISHIILLHHTVWGRGEHAHTHTQNVERYHQATPLTPLSERVLALQQYIRCVCICWGCVFVHVRVKEDDQRWAEVGLPRAHTAGHAELLPALWSTRCCVLLLPALMDLRSALLAIGGSVCSFKLVHELLGRLQASPREGRRAWRQRNIGTSLVHSSLSGAWAVLWCV